MTTPAKLRSDTRDDARASSEPSPLAIVDPNPESVAPAGNTNGARPPRLSPYPKDVAAGGFLELRVWSEMFEDAQRARIACDNRAERGGVDPLISATQIEALKKAEHMIALAMRKCFKRIAPEIHAWMLDTPGVGEHLLARLIGCIGHPRHATPYHWEGTRAKRTLVADEPYERIVSQLWSYCGHGDPNRKKRKGMTAEEAFALGNPRAKMLVWNLAVSCMKEVGSPAKVVADPRATSLDAADLNSDDEARVKPNSSSSAPRRRSPYRDTYDSARAAYIDRVHATECVRCGPSGKPALEGSPWSAAHQHAAALRLTGKEILRDLWIVAGRTPSPRT